MLRDRHITDVIKILAGVSSPCLLDCLWSHSQGNVQSEGIIPLSSSQTSPGFDAHEINTGLEHNVEEASTSPKEGTQRRNQKEAEIREIGMDTVTCNSEEMTNECERLLLNIDELFMKETILQSQILAAVMTGPGHPSSSRANPTWYSYPNDEYGNAFPISIFVRDWLRWNCKSHTRHCFACCLFTKLPDPSKSSLSKPIGCNK